MKVSGSSYTILVTLSTGVTPADLTKARAVLPSAVMVSGTVTEYVDCSNSGGWLTSRTVTLNVTMVTARVLLTSLTICTCTSVGWGVGGGDGAGENGV